MDTTPTPDKKTPRQPVPVPTAVRESRKGIMDRSAAAGIPALPLLGRLPLSRRIPQDLHSLLDYQGALTVAGVGLLSGSKAACTAGLAFGFAGAGVALLTDYRLSLKKLIPIEVHEVIDYVWSIGVIAAPFVFGYSRRSRWVTLMHTLVGASTIAASLFTDYRAQLGLQWGKGRKTDLGPVGG
ncbi:hypothetical protein JQX13_02305 [Archangium violaceum]|uniref:hypothetical protein n=1 Tax=Archangium violaceum TaxID=83451 RepID=UPI00193B333A|nr:hypothetical protein [Archangium violaceum]QRK09019.1 hypothetical protein JQX13_02305 [Archangium violaceum]